MSNESYFVTVLLLVAIGSLTGCGGGPSAVLPPDIDADDAAALAMETYDTDGNGLIEGAELENAPSLNAAMATLDTDNDGKVSEDEIAERIRSWQSSRVGITTIRCQVVMGGRPLAGAVVTFDPEDFLGEYVLEAVGTSDSLGFVTPKIPKENRPAPDTPPGLQLGFYKVRISQIVDGTEKIAAKYNSETTLGQQVASDDPGVVSHRILFRLEK